MFFLFLNFDQGKLFFSFGKIFKNYSYVFLCYSLQTKKRFGKDYFLRSFMEKKNFGRFFDFA